MRFLGWLFAMAAHGFLAGLLLLVGVFWWHGHGLPDTDELARYEPPTLSRVHAGDGSVLAEFARQHRLFTPIDEIPELVRHAFISAEDKRFYEHEGFDGLGFINAMVQNIQLYMAGRRLRGASTITQQVVKNFLLSGERALSRKIREIILATRLEAALTKDEILEIYLNEIYLGQRAYGVTSAALRYFGARLEDLTPAQAAFLAALPKAPSEIDPIRSYDRAIARRNFVLREMFENGYITEAEYEEAIATDLDTILDDEDPETARRAPPPLDYFAEEIRRELIDDPQFGEDGVYGGGLSIRSTIDPELQEIARSVLQQRLWEFSRDNGYIGPAASIEVVEPIDEAGLRAALDDLDLPRDVDPWRLAVVVLVGERSAQIVIEDFESAEPIYVPFSDVSDWAARREGLDGERMVVGDAPQTPADVWSLGDVIYVEPVYAEDGVAIERWSMRQIPEVNGGLVAMDPHTGRVLAMQGGFSFQASVFNRVTQAERQPGSAFKPFVFAAALEAGYDPNTIVLDAPITLEQPNGDTWEPENSSRRFYGPLPLRQGLERSLNAMTVRLALDFGLDPIAAYAERFGVYDHMPRHWAYTLGSGETTLLRMTASYAMFVNGGRLIHPTFIDRIQDRHGDTIFRHDGRICTECLALDWNGQEEPYVPTEGEQVMDPVTAYQIVSMLEGVTIRGTAATTVGQALDFPVAGKTGTTDNLRDAWFIGFSSDLLVGCYIGFDTPRFLGDRQYGGTLCGPVFARFMEQAVGEGEGREFRRPSVVDLVRLDRETGCAVAPATPGEGLIWEAFRLEDAPYVGDCPEGGIGLGGLLGAEDQDPTGGQLVIGGVESGFGGLEPTSVDPAAGGGFGSGLGGGGAAGFGPRGPREDDADSLSRDVLDAIGGGASGADDESAGLGDRRSDPPALLPSGQPVAGPDPSEPADGVEASVGDGLGSGGGFETVLPTAPGEGLGGTY